MLKCIIIALLISTTYCLQAQDLGFDQDSVEFNRFLIQIGWNYQKINVINETINELTNELNATVVAWQNIYNKDGSLKEIRTVEFVVSKKGDPNSNDEDEEDEDIWDQIGDMMQEVEDLAAVDMHGAFSYDKFEPDGELEEAAYIELDNIYVFYDKIAYLNHTIHANEEDVKKYIKDRENTNIPIGVLSRDVDGKLIEAESKLSAIAFTSVVSTNVNKKLTISALESFTLANIRYPDKLPKYLVKYMNEKEPNYQWFATRETDASYISENFKKITLQNELVGYTDDYVPYTLYGIKK